MSELPALRDLQAFLEVAKTANLSRAAERLGVAQPTLSVGMQRLEGVLGAVLFVRDKRGVTLTAAGRRLVGQAQSLCEAWQRLRDRVLAARHEVAGGYLLGVHTAVASYALGCLPGLLRAHPKLTIHLLHGLSRRLFEATLSRRCDMALVINAPRHPDMVLRHLCRDEVTLWHCASAPASDTLLCDPSLQQTQNILRALRRRKTWTFARRLESSSLEVIAQLTAAGTGTGILPAQVARPCGLQALPHAPVVYDSLSFAYRADNRGVPAIRAMSRALATRAQAQPGPDVNRTIGPA